MNRVFVQPDRQRCPPQLTWVRPQLSGRTSRNSSSTTLASALPSPEIKTGVCPVLLESEGFCGPCCGRMFKKPQCTDQEPQNGKSSKFANSSRITANRKLRKTSDRIACKFRIRLLDLNWTHLQDRSETCRPLSATYRIGCTPTMEGRGWH